MSSSRQKEGNHYRSGRRYVKRGIAQGVGVYGRKEVQNEKGKFTFTIGIWFG